MLLPTDEVNTYSGAVSYNVLEHIEDHVAALRSMARLVRPGGRVVLIVPAFPFAMSPVDIATGHVRRYTKKSMRQALADAGLAVEQLRYVNALGLIGYYLATSVFRLTPKEGPMVKLYDQFVLPATRDGRTPGPPALRPVRVRGGTRPRIGVGRVSRRPALAWPRRPSRRAASAGTPGPDAPVTSSQSGQAPLNQSTGKPATRCGSSSLARGLPVPAAAWSPRSGLVPAAPAAAPESRGPGSAHTDHRAWVRSQAVLADLMISSPDAARARKYPLG